MSDVVDIDIDPQVVAAAIAAGRLRFRSFRATRGAAEHDAFEAAPALIEPAPGGWTVYEFVGGAS